METMTLTVTVTSCYLTHSTPTPSTEFSRRCRQSTRRCDGSPSAQLFLLRTPGGKSSLFFVFLCVAKLEVLDFPYLPSTDPKDDGVLSMRLLCSIRDIKLRHSSNTLFPTTLMELGKALEDLHRS